MADFYQADELNPLWLVLIFWLFWPGLMFLVGWIGESRLIPVGKHQSKAFLPGDLTLGVMYVALIGNLYSMTCGKVKAALVAAFMTSITIAYVFLTDYHGCAIMVVI